MLECRYVNSLGAEFIFNIENNRLNKSDIRDYEWNYIEQFNKVKAFNSTMKTRNIVVTFFERLYYMYHNEVYYKAQDLYAITDVDVRTLKSGKLYIGDYYINCYIVGSAKQEYDNGVIIRETLSVLSDFRWIKEVNKTFGGATPYEPTPGERDYPYDYKWDYVIGNNARRLFSDSIAPFDFRIIFQGPAESPMLKVQARNEVKTYQVFTKLEMGEYLAVDSYEKTIIKTKVNGEKINEFGKRDRNHYIFDKMPVNGGNSIIIFEPGSIVSITAYVERSEPKWI